MSTSRKQLFIDAAIETVKPGDWPPVTSTDRNWQRVDRGGSDADFETNLAAVDFETHLAAADFEGWSAFFFLPTGNGCHPYVSHMFKEIADLNFPKSAGFRI